MAFEIGLPSIATFLVATLVLVIISDFLLEVFSARLSVSTGRMQSWFFEHVGRWSFFDFILAGLLQFFSFRKKAFFQQLGSLISVGSFAPQQLLIIIPGSFVGWGLSLCLLYGGPLVFGVGLLLGGLLLGINSKEQVKDLGVAFLSIALLFIAFHFFDQYLAQSTLNIRTFQVGEGLVFLAVIGAAALFRTPLPFILVMALFYNYLNLNLFWIPIFYFLYSLASLAKFYWNIFLGRRRLYFSIAIVFTTQVTQLVFGLVLVQLMAEPLGSWLQADRFFSGYQGFVLFSMVYFVGGGLFAVLLLFPLRLLDLEGVASSKKESQKIIVSGGRGDQFSLHLSLFLLRQEFVKFVTSNHTLFKLAREMGAAEDDLHRRYSRYQSMLIRVGAELKELCFSIGRQRCYRWQVLEVMTYYRLVNQLELLVDDLGYVTRLLSEQHFEDNREKDCRFWLGLQLKNFESFLSHVVGVDQDDPGKRKANVEKSYEVLDRFFADDKGVLKGSSQTFYRITESIASLSIDLP